MPAPIDPTALAGAPAKGRRPAYFDDPATDRILSIVMALVAEVGVVRERLDTVERLLEANGHLTRADIEAYAPGAAAGRERGQLQREWIARALRGVQQAMEAGDDPPIETISAALKDG